MAFSNSQTVNSVQIHHVTVNWLMTSYPCSSNMEVVAVAYFPFSIAFAYHAARGDNLCQMEFNQERTRLHLVSCLEDDEFTPFPQSPNRTTRPPTYLSSFRLYCDCDMPESIGNMIECDLCSSWHHMRCVRWLARKFCNA